MSYSIVYSSRTGNTALLAQALKETLPQADCLYYGAPDAKALAAQTIYVGFWTDKGTCDADTAQFLQNLTHQQVFLFGTAGFGGNDAYFSQILERVQALLPEAAECVGSYMCQGKMPHRVRARSHATADSPQCPTMPDNFDRALSHPDDADLLRLKAAVTK